MLSERSSWITGGFVIVLMVLLMASLLRLGDARAAALDAQANLIQMRNLVKRIEVLRQGETRAMLQGEQRVEDSKTWIDCVRAAGLEERQIHTINRLPVQKIAKTSYSRDDVFIEIDNITTPQLINILLKCEDASMAYKAISVHLTRVPTNSSPQDRWNLDLLLMRLLYSTTSKPGA